MQKLFLSLPVVLALTAAPAAVVVGPWTPVFQGVDHAEGRRTPEAGNPIEVTNQVVQVLRIDLTDPGVELFTDPACANCPAGYETRGNTTSGFLETHRLQGAVNGNFSVQCCSEKPGDPMSALGLLMSGGQVVSPTWTPADAPVHGLTYYPVLLFTPQKAPTFIASNWPPADLDSVFTAVAGNRAILAGGTFAGIDSDVDPRTAIGTSEDGSYLFFLTIDGRQPGYSDGATDYQLAEWLLRFGVHNAIGVDGGGSTSMAIAQCPGTAVQLNVPIDRGVRGQERVIAAHLGFRARPLPGFINDLAVDAQSTAATITWTTLSEASTQVEYGPTPAYGQFTPFDPTPSLFHSVTLDRLMTTSNYFFRVISSTEAATFTAESCFRTVYFVAGTVFELTNSWTFSVSNLDGVAWQAPDYDDSGWPQGRGLLYIETDPIPAPMNTPLPIASTTYPYLTYYFRTHFTYTNTALGSTLVLSNYIDDGAVFYLNGAEIHRALMPPAPQPITNGTLATNYPCSGDTTCPHVFTVAGDLITNLLQGENVLAVEVHNYHPRSSDIVFGSALLFTAAPPPPPPPFIENLGAQAGETNATIAWTTPSNATTQVEYGLTPALGTYTGLDPTLGTGHAVTLTDLLPRTNYYFRAISAAGGVQHTASGVFHTDLYLPLISRTNLWRFTTNRLDDPGWRMPGFDDGDWLGSGLSLLGIEDNPDVYPMNTPLPGVPRSLAPTYYFRARFTCDGSRPDLALLFTNSVDDGAVFYLNGTEIQRVRMPPWPQTVLYTSQATTTPAFGDALYPDVFRISGDWMTNLLAGENVLAAEVHQNAANSSDIVFGSLVGLVRPLLSEARMRVGLSSDAVCVTWFGPGFTLQQSGQLDDPGSWADVPGPITTSPYCVTNPAGAVFFRLRE